MKLKIFIDKNREEEVLVYAHEKSDLTEAIERLVTETAEQIIGYKENEIIRLTVSNISCFIVENNKIFAVTDSEKIFVKSRLYKIEEKLPNSFIKINQSCIANIDKIERFSAVLSGSLTVRFKNGYCDYVSRRCLKNVKERLGI